MKISVPRPHIASESRSDLFLVSRVALVDSFKNVNCGLICVSLEAKPFSVYVVCVGRTKVGLYV